MDWIIGMVLMVIYVIGPIFSFGIFLLIGFVRKTIGGIFGGGYGGGHGGAPVRQVHSYSGGNFSPGLRELNELRSPPT
ncbi:hypothetical protein [Candidatus Nitrospira neomarina]|uniref:Uncharacterized protein n=1 Tax=Candidatus Nitrospira neomarina TaxID=3020899 RepID=A0AA96GKE9_9BACT|nr:hypothetical protein [Candidatus Nitrospira neomarina]WNM61895.1 hypothetical protein PQG83_19455 [Candidatus Nitrospira neomarina]